jgi:hypothetical protein
MVIHVAQRSLIIGTLRFFGLYEIGDDSKAQAIEGFSDLRQWLQNHKI